MSQTQTLQTSESPETSQTLQIPNSETPIEEIETLRTMNLAELLNKDVWTRLHPATKIVIKALQHIKSKISDMAEVRASIDDCCIVVTTNKSKLMIDGINGIIEFIRYIGNVMIRAQRARVKLPKDVIEVIGEQIRLVLESDAEPHYGLVAYVVEKALRE